MFRPVPLGSEWAECGPGIHPKALTPLASLGHPVDLLTPRHFSHGVKEPAFQSPLALFEVKEMEVPPTKRGVSGKEEGKQGGSRMLACSSPVSGTGALIWLPCHPLE